MKRSLTTITALLLAAAMFAQGPTGQGPQGQRPPQGAPQQGAPQGQRPPKPGQGQEKPGAQGQTVQSRLVENYVTKQDAYMPDFSIDGKNTKIKNVILMIGDGMGLGATASAYFGNGGELTMTNLRTLGYVLTQSNNNFTTDSAASGTAFATGSKTNNGYLGVSPDGEKLTNIPEIIEPLGYACGVLSTDDLNGATPAAFFAHQRSRTSTESIWGDLSTSHLVFASAGTMGGFERLPFKTQEDIKSAYTLVGDGKDPRIADSKKLLYLPQSVKLDRGNYLPETTELALNYLSQRSKKGFFIMIEGARIDKESHSNNYGDMIKETLDFDKAVEAAIRFAEKDGHTLVLITADHETGAIVVRNGILEDGYVQATYSSTGHSPMMVPLYAYGPHSRDFSGYQHNSDICNKIVELFTKGKVSGR